MKVLFLDAPTHLVEERKRLGIDIFDEVWEGIYYMVPPPSFEHQEIASDLVAILSPYCKRFRLGKVVAAVGVRDVQSEAEDYRVPDLVFLRKGRERILSADGNWLDQGPDVVVEIRSPREDPYEKIPFYAKVGVKELIIIDRDKRTVEIYRLIRKRFLALSPNADGWLYCEGLKTFFKSGRTRTAHVLRLKLELDGSEHSI